MKNEEVKPIKGTVHKIVYRNEANGYTVFTIRTDKGYPVSITGSFEEPPVPHSYIIAYGNLDKESKYKGIQFKAVGMTVEQGEGDPFHLARYLMSLVKYLGEDKAYKIAKKFGSRLETVLENSPDLLMEVDGIGQSICNSIKAAWVEARTVKSIRIFLMKLGLPDRRINQIIKNHGTEYEEVIKADPYALMSDGISFDICDSIAEMLDVACDSVTRVAGLTRSILMRTTQDGNLFLPSSDLMSAISRFNMDADRKISSSAVDPKLVVSAIAYLKDNGYVVIEGDHLYDIELFYYERKSAQILSQLIQGDTPTKLKRLDMDKFISSYEKRARASNPDFKLSDQQEEAIRSFQTEKVMVVTGPPGTGKTTILKAFVNVLEETGLKFALMAPTGVAAKRLEQSAGYPASTIHRKLGYRGDKWEYGLDRPLDAQAIIVDESSMIDSELFFRVVSSLTPECRLVLVGDVHQLPSVGPGSVLKELINSGSTKVIRLNKIHRQAETSSIVIAASEIKDGDTSLSAFKFNDLSHDAVLIPTGNDEEKGMEVVVNLAKRLTSVGSRFQVITPRNMGSMSVSTINKELQNTLNPQVDPKKEFQLDKETSLRLGDKILVTKNNYSLGVFNGDIGIVHEITVRDIHMKMLDSEDLVILPLQFVKESVKHAYAMTGHRTQGMEYPVVIMTLVKGHGRNLLQRNLVYTALTRAKKKVIVVGSEHAFTSAIENDEIQQRNTRLAQSLVKACSGEDLLAPLRKISPDASNARRISHILEGDTKSRVMKALAESDSCEVSYEIDDNGKFTDDREIIA